MHPQRREKALGTRLRAKLTLSVKVIFKINVLHWFNQLNTFLFRKLCFLKTIYTNYSSLIIDLLPFESCLDYHFPVVLNFHALKWSKLAHYNFQLHVDKIFFSTHIKRRLPVFQGFLSSSHLQHFECYSKSLFSREEVVVGTAQSK